MAQIGSFESPSRFACKARYGEGNEATEAGARAPQERNHHLSVHTRGQGCFADQSGLYTVDQLFLDRPGNDAIQLNLLHNYQSNLALYDGWHQFFRNKQPKTLIVWGKNDPFFTVEGAQAYLRDIPKAELLLLDTGHFALEDSSEFIAQKIVKFFA
jgi:pimeloyl-ACP methyl ester carboxylesterase